MTKNTTPVSVSQVCIYPKCNCPFDAPSDPAWCARGLPHTPPAAPVARNVKACVLSEMSRASDLLRDAAHGKTMPKHSIRPVVERLEFAAKALKGEATLSHAGTAAPVAQGELGTLCFHIEQAIENGCCPPDIEDAYEAYAKATAA